MSTKIIIVKAPKRKVPLAISKRWEVLWSEAIKAPYSIFGDSERTFTTPTQNKRGFMSYISTASLDGISDELAQMTGLLHETGHLVGGSFKFLDWLEGKVKKEDFQKYITCTNILDDIQIDNGIIDIYPRVAKVYQKIMDKNYSSMTQFIQELKDNGKSIADAKNIMPLVFGIICIAYGSNDYTIRQYGDGIYDLFGITQPSISELKSVIYHASNYHLPVSKGRYEDYKQVVEELMALIPFPPEEQQQQQNSNGNKGKSGNGNKKGNGNGKQEKGEGKESDEDEESGGSCENPNGEGEGKSKGKGKGKGESGKVIVDGYGFNDEDTEDQSEEGEGGEGGEGDGESEGDGEGESDEEFTLTLEIREHTTDAETIEELAKVNHAAIGHGGMEEVIRKYNVVGETTLIPIFKRAFMNAKRGYDLAYADAGVRVSVSRAVQNRAGANVKVFKNPSIQSLENSKWFFLIDTSGSVYGQVGEYKVLEYELDVLKTIANILPQTVKYEVYSFESGERKVCEVTGRSVISKTYEKIKGGGGTYWSYDLIQLLLRKEKEGYQIVVLTDGAIDIYDKDTLDRLLLHTHLRPLIFIFSTAANFESNTNGSGNMFSQWGYKTDSNYAVINLNTMQTTRGFVEYIKKIVSSYENR